MIIIIITVIILKIYQHLRKCCGKYTCFLFITSRERRFLIYSNHISYIPINYIVIILKKVYSQLDENDVFEWGDISFENQLKKFTFRTSKESIDEITEVFDVKLSQSQMRKIKEALELNDLNKNT